MDCLFSGGCQLASCFLLLECVIKVTRKELLEWSNIILPFFSLHIFCNYKLSSRNRNILKKDIILQKICLKEILSFSKSNSSWLCTYYILWLTHHLAPANPYKDFVCLKPQNQCHFSEDSIFSSPKRTCLASLLSFYSLVHSIDKSIPQ